MSLNELNIFNGLLSLKWTTIRCNFVAAFFEMGNNRPQKSLWLCLIGAPLCYQFVFVLKSLKGQLNLSG